MSKHRWVGFGLVLALLCVAYTANIAIVGARAVSSIDPALADALKSQSGSQQISVIVILKDQENVKAISGSSRADQQRKVILALHKKADDTQGPLLSQLQNLIQQGKVTMFTPLWIFNAIAVTTESTVIDQLAQSPLVSKIVLDATIQGPARVGQSTSSGPPEPNLNVINAPALWNLGYRGQGIVVANMDTGVDYTHPDLVAQWRGGGNSWYDPYSQHPVTPTDLNGHGTWTMGVMVGRDNGGTSIGVAPQATWIAVKIFNDSGVATTSAVHQGFQWLLDPDGNPATADAPNVVNNSWAFGNVGGCDLSFEPDLQSLVAAGITPVFAAGNYGPNGSTSVSPANIPEAFAVGATDNNDGIYSGSSRGPTSCGGTARTYPDVMAPGVSIKTTDLYGFYYTTTGTSLAAPHVAGALALLLSAYPNLTVAQQRAALANSAVDLGTAGADNTFGAGRIDVLAAYNTLANSTPPTATPTTAPTRTPTPIQPTNTPTRTSTPLPPTNTPTPTSTPLPPTNTPTPTSTPLPPTNTPTRTSTPLPPTNTPTRTPVPPTNTPTRTPTPVADAIFADGFETGTLSAWSAATTGSGRLSVSTSAKLVGAWGMQALINSTSGIYVTDKSPAAEATYHARFYFSPNGLAMADGTSHDIFIGRSAAGTTIFRVQLGRSSGSYQVRAGLRDNSGSTQYTNWYTISNAGHAIEIAWLAATTSGGANGAMSVWLDGTLKQTRSGVTNDTYRLEEVRLGPSSGLSSGTSGTEYFDAFASTRATYIGP